LTVNGHSVHFVSFGSGEDVVFLHGWGANLEAFLFIAQRLSGYRVTLIDFAGFGKSEEPKTPYSVKDYSCDVIAILKAVGIEKACFVGHSFGGRVCLELGANYPELVKKLVLIDSAGLKPRRGLKYYIRVGLHKLLRKLGRKGLSGSADFSALSPLMKETFKLVVNYDQSALLNKINCPTAIFWGNEDKETPRYMAKKLNKGIKDSNIFWLNGGHFSYIDDRERFFIILKAFL